MGLNAHGTLRLSPLGVERPPSLGEVAAERLKEAILSGHLAPGTRLVEAELTAELGISRTPLREALRTLSALGLVTISPTRRAHVARPPRENLADAVLLQVVLEGVALHLLAASADTAVFRDLERLVEGLEVAERQADHQRANDFAWRFHEMICAKCGNDFLLPAWNMLAVRLRLNDTLREELAPRSVWMRELLAHARAGEGAAAENALRRHLLAASRDN